MASFDYSFTVNAPQKAVRAFHHDTSILKTLTPPVIPLQIHMFEPLGNGSKAEFTMWFGFIPIRWRVIHSNVGEQGFMDSMVSGPMKLWRHTHTFHAIDEYTTTVHEHIEYAHPAGLKGLLTRLLFNRPGLTFLFTYRKFITRYKVAKQ